jgi:acetyl esterase/lipase
MKHILLAAAWLLISGIMPYAADAPAVNSGAPPAANTRVQVDARTRSENRPRKQKSADGTAVLAARIPLAFPDFDHTPNVIYKRVGDQELQLDVLTPKGLTSAPAPVLVYIHGGGWAGGDRYRMLRPDISGVFHRCGKAGIICVSIEYRLNAANVTAFDSAVDCKDALRFLVKNAAQYCIDPTRIGTIGGSAGGHLSLVTALGDPKDFPGDPALAGNDPAALRCEVAYYPATDFTDRALAERFLGTRATVMFGGPPAEKAEVIRLLSPVAHINKDSTPIYCFHGDHDETLPVENSRHLFAKGKEAGADIQYTEVKNGRHGFGSDCSPTVDEICTMAAQFVIERLLR